MAGNGTITPDGYRLIRRPDHPLANRWGTVPEHRQVLYDAIGDGEHPCRWCGKVLTWRDKRISYKINADHVDGDRLNNALSNLVPACMDDIHSRIKGAEYSIRRTLTTIRSRLDSVEHALDNGRVLNPMGELQSLGPQFDAAVAVLATLREVRSALGIQEGGTSDE